MVAKIGHQPKLTLELWVKISNTSLGEKNVSEFFLKFYLKLAAISEKRQNNFKKFRKKTTESKIVQKKMQNFL